MNWPPSLPEYAGTLLLLGIALLGAVIAVCIALRSARRISNPIWRLLVRSLVLLGSPMLTFVLWMQLETGHTRGKWRCAVCALDEQRDTMFGLVLRRAAVDTSEIDELGKAAEFHDWYTRNFHAPHQHVWFTVGCHYSACGVGCSFYPPDLWYTALPRLCDASLAAPLLHRLEHAAPRDAWHLLAWFDGEPWTRIASGEPIAQEEARTRVNDWLAAHPEWR